MDETKRVYMIFRPSGGLIYHWRAWRKQALWKDFTKQIADWLADWNPPVTKLVLIGPSAGYTLPTQFLKRFAQIQAYDLDPLAPFFFRWRHPGIKAKFHRENVFWVNGRLSLEQISSIKARHPGAAFLFTNVLGQILLEGEALESEWNEFLGGVRSLMKGRHWASYHDVFTYEGGEVIDHLTEGRLSQGLSSRQFRWELSEASTHMIEGVTGHP